MKKTFLALSMFGVISLTVNATIFYNESFSYGDGALTNVSGGIWVAHSGSGATPVNVSGGAALVSGSSAQDVHRDTGVAMGAGETWYAGFDVSVSGSSASSVNFAHFLQGTSLFGGRVFVTAPTSGGDFAFGVSGTSTVDQIWATDSTFGNSYRLVVSYDYNTGNSKLWINPTLETDTSLTSVNGFANDLMTSFALRQASSPTTEAIDNLVVATSFSEALTGIAVPEPGTLGISMLGALMLLGLKARRS